MSSGTVTCGHTVQISSPKSGNRFASFRVGMCRSCPLKPRCCPTQPGRKLRITQHEQLLQTGRLALRDPIATEHLRRTRPRIERLLGLLAHRYGTRKSRYIGSAKARLQVAWAAALVNLNPIRRQRAATA
jgi:hypothetical protein